MHTRRQSGFPVYFKIEDVGLSSDNDAEAVQIYKWALRWAVRSSQFDRCREAANFLNQVREATSPKGETRLSLAVAKDQNSITGSVLATEPISFMHSVRNYHSPGDQLGEHSLLAKF